MFTFHNDPGHGWLKVTLIDLRRLGFAPADFSRYSYRHGNVFYLEEDCDAPKFLAVWEAKNGRKAQINDVYSARTFIRALPSIQS